MFRITQFMRELIHPTPVTPRRNPPGPVVIWNLTRTCNLLCVHCYTNSTSKPFEGELTTAEVNATMDDLKKFRVPVLILSGGEPLLRPDIFDISRRAKSMGFYVGLSTNGTLIDSTNVATIAKIGYDYVGISLDGVGKRHEDVRRIPGCFDKSLAAMRLCRDAGIKVGARFTLSERNAADFDDMLDLVHRERIDKFYLSHLNYSGRGKVHRKEDAHFLNTRRIMNRVFDEAWRCAKEDIPREFVTGNNDADGPFLLAWVREKFPDRADHMQGKLRQWGGNSTGVNISNIDNLGNVHPDSFWWEYSLGNVRNRAFSEIWADVSEPLMAGLKARPRPLKGRCGACTHVDICNGNTRTRAFTTTKDPWAEDPGCYLTDDEIGL